MEDRRANDQALRKNGIRILSAYTLSGGVRLWIITEAEDDDGKRALLARLRKSTPDPGSDQKPKGTWKAILGWAVGTGVVLLAAFAAVNVPPYGDLNATTYAGRPRAPSARSACSPLRNGCFWIAFMRILPSF